MPDTDSRFFSNPNGNVYALKNLPEEVVAYLFARYSRSRLSLRDDLRNMMDAEDLGALIGPGGMDDSIDAVSPLQERARAFAEKYVLGYGHSSVAEHGVVHLALENVSIIASKLVEDARLASYTEKSTRYVAFDPDKAYFPPNVMADAKLGAEYRRAVRGLLEAYTGWMEDFVAQIQARTPRGEKQTERAYEAASRATAFDLLRYLLPTATHTNVGLTLNARALEHLIVKLLSQPLEEGRALGAQMKAEARHVVPTLLKYADYNAYRAETSDAIDELATELLGDLTPPRSSATLSLLRRGWEPERAGEVSRAGEISPVSLVFSDPDADNILVAAILYGAAHLPMEVLLARVKAFTDADKERVVDEYLKRRGKHDAPGRALERVFCTVEMTMDYGAYRDVQRHRMATQTTQALTPALGFERPADFETFGYAEQYDRLMAQSADTYARLCAAGFVHEAAYVLPLATRIRALFTWNLREVTHFVELRSARQGHPSYRKIAQDVYRAIEESYPLIARYMRPNLNTYAFTRE
jgi:thymidylate synthase ThyX